MSGGDTALARAVEPLARAHPDEPGIFAVRDGRDAFAARVLLADAAEETLDVQYYIWHPDMSGTLLFFSRCAAPPIAGCACGCSSTTTTRPASIQSSPRSTHGGRNVGDEYFGAGNDFLFIESRRHRHRQRGERRHPRLRALLVQPFLAPCRRGAAQESSAPKVKDRGLTGSSASRLHAKTFSVDRSHVFVGSFNFDPRSARLNTELGFVIDSPSLAQASADTFAAQAPGRAYRVELGEKGRLRWAEQLISLLPIEWLL